MSLSTPEPTGVTNAESIERINRLLDKVASDEARKAKARSEMQAAILATREQITIETHPERFSRDAIKANESRKKVLRENRVRTPERARKEIEAVHAYVIEHVCTLPEGCKATGMSYARYHYWLHRLEMVSPPAPKRAGRPMGSKNKNGRRV